MNIEYIRKLIEEKKSEVQYLSKKLKQNQAELQGLEKLDKDMMIEDRIKNINLGTIK